MSRSEQKIVQYLNEAHASEVALVRARESSIIFLGAVIGALAGLVVAAMSFGVTGLHWLLFGVAPADRLSALSTLDPTIAVLVPLLGGLAFGLALLAVARWRPAREVDPIEANALHGGRMSLTGSVSVALQTVWSSGVGASVGLEAGYTQLASRIVLEADRATLLGNQVEATRAHNGEVLQHLHDWEPERIRDVLDVLVQALLDLLGPDAVGVDRVGQVAHHRLDLHPVGLLEELDQLLALVGHVVAEDALPWCRARCAH